MTLRRVYTFLAIVMTACLFYYVAALLIVHRIGQWLRLAPPRPNRPTGYVDVCGYQVSVWLVIALWTILPATFLSLQLSYALRRRHRDKRDLCLECGYRLKSHRGHCPGCGTRVGVGLSPRRYAL